MTDMLGSRYYFDPDRADDIYGTQEALADALKLSPGQIVEVGVFERKHNVFATIMIDTNSNERLVLYLEREEAEVIARKSLSQIAAGGITVKIRRSIIPIDGPATIRDIENQLVTKVALHLLPDAIQKRLRKSPQCYAHAQLKDNAWIIGEEVVGPRW